MVIIAVIPVYRQGSHVSSGPRMTRPMGVETALPVVTLRIAEAA